MSDIIERLKKAAEDFEAIRAYSSNDINSDCEPHYSDQTDMAEASQAAIDAVAEIVKLRAALTTSPQTNTLCEHEWFDCSNSAIQAPTKSCKKCGWTVHDEDVGVGMFIVWPWLAPSPAPRPREAVEGATGLSHEAHL